MLPEGEVVMLCAPVKLPAALGVCPLALARPLGLPRGVGLTDAIKDPETVVVLCALPVPIPVELPDGLKDTWPLALPAGVPVRDCVEDPETLAEPVRLRTLAVAQPVPAAVGVSVPIPVELTEGLRLC